MSISSRLARLQEAAASAKNGKIAVLFEDGHTEHVDGGTAVDLALAHDSGAVSFTAKPGSGHGLLPDLLTGLLEHRKDD